MLAIVQDEEKTLGSQAIRECFHQRTLWLFANVEGFGSKLGDHVRIGSGRQFHQPHTAWIFREQVGGNPQREPCLAATASTGKR